MAWMDSSGADGRDSLALGRRVARARRAAAFSPLALWLGSSLSEAARTLRNLRGIYTQTGDVVRLLGTVDRLRAIGAHSRLAVSDAEMRECAGQLALCLHAVRWEQRREEARLLLEGLLRYDDEARARGGAGDGGAVEEVVDRERIERLLMEPWFAGKEA